MAKGLLRTSEEPPAPTTPTDRLRGTNAGQRARRLAFPSLTMGRLPKCTLLTIVLLTILSYAEAGTGRQG
jgi:hypothetical protein